MLFRNPFDIPDVLLGEQLADNASDAFMTLALARGSDLVDAAVGWYDCLIAVHWKSSAPDLATDIIRSGYRDARERLRDSTPADEVPDADRIMRRLRRLVLASLDQRRSFSASPHLYRSPFGIDDADISGAQLVDVAADAFTTIALARGADLVEAAIGWYDRIVMLHWEGVAFDMASDVLQVGYHDARARLRDIVPAGEIPMAVSQMQAFASLLTSALDREGREAA